MAPVPGKRHLSLAQLVYGELRGKILSQELPAGAALREEALAETFDVSRVPVREALQELASDGLIERRPRIGFFVRDLSAADLDDLLEISAALDAILFRKMSENLTEQSQAAVTSLLTRTRSAIDAGDTGAARDLNAQFHRLAREIAGSAILRDMVERTETRLAWLLTQHDDPAVFLAQHQQLFSAMLAGDGEVLRQAIAEHSRVSAASSRDLKGTRGCA